MGEGLGEGLGDRDGSGLIGKSAAGAAVQAAATTTGKTIPMRLFRTMSLAIDVPAPVVPHDWRRDPRRSRVHWSNCMRGAGWDRTIYLAAVPPGRGGAGGAPIG